MSKYRGARDCLQAQDLYSVWYIAQSILSYGWVYLRMYWVSLVPPFHYMLPEAAQDTAYAFTLHGPLHAPHILGLRNIPERVDINLVIYVKSSVFWLYKYKHSKFWLELWCHFLQILQNKCLNCFPLNYSIYIISKFSRLIQGKMEL